jgi:hypothetical protein
MGKREPNVDEFTAEETARRSDAALLRAFSAPRKRHVEMKIGKHKIESAEKANPPKRRVTAKAKVKTLAFWALAV